MPKGHGFQFFIKKEARKWLNKLDKSGIQTVHSFRQEFPDVKVITITGGLNFGKGIEHVNALYSLHKPIPRKELLTAVKSALNGTHIPQNTF